VKLVLLVLLVRLDHEVLLAQQDRRDRVLLAQQVPQVQTELVVLLVLLDPKVLLALKVYQELKELQVLRDQLVLQVHKVIQV
jgi:hypothetical protein